MKKLSFTAVALFVGLFSVSIFGQQPTPSATPPDDTSVKITTSLIQLDVVVTDKDGKPVTDLKADDFKIFQDGKPQKVSSLSYVSSQTAQTAQVRARGRDAKKEIAPPPTNVRSEQGRIITFVLDDGNCLATIDGTVNMRESMKKFVDEEMLPDDRVAIYRTRGGSSLLQMYTSNKDVLRQKIAKISLLTSGSCGSAFDTVRNDTITRSTVANSTTDPNDTDKQFKDANNDRERQTQVIGTIGVLNFVVDRLKNIPARKLVFLMSEGIVAKFDSRAYDALRELADKASRASVVINTFSNKGLTIPGMIRAEDELFADQTTDVANARINEERALNEGLGYLAYTTGGKFVRNKAFMEGDIKKILDAETGYYLVGYEPDDETFKGKEFHKIDIKVDRPGYSVVSRKGFYGRTDRESQPVYKTADSPLFQAISSPFEENGIDLQLTTLYGNSPSEGNYIRALFHIKGSDLTMTDDTTGNKKVVLDVVAVILDEKGKVADEFNRTYPIHIPNQAVSTILQNGLDFSSDMTIKKPGIYSYRIAVRDNGSKRLGSAGDFVEIPDTKKGNFFVSGLAMTDMDNNGAPILPQSRPVNAAFAPVLSRSIPSIRQFTAGSALSYGYTIYNAKLNGSVPNLTRQVRLYRDGTLIADGGEKPITPRSISDVSRIDDFGTIRITDGTAAGEYALQIIVRDKTADRTSTQSIDFEVVQ